MILPVLITHEAPAHTQPLLTTEVHKRRQHAQRGPEAPAHTIGPEAPAHTHTHNLWRLCVLARAGFCLCVYCIVTLHVCWRAHSSSCVMLSESMWVWLPFLCPRVRSEMFSCNGNSPLASFSPARTQLHSHHPCVLARAFFILCDAIRVDVGMVAFFVSTSSQ
jgi:hypothetical protein